MPAEATRRFYRTSRTSEHLGHTQACAGQVIKSGRFLQGIALGMTVPRTSSPHMHTAPEKQAAVAWFKHAGIGTTAVDMHFENGC